MFSCRVKCSNKEIYTSISDESVPLTTPQHILHISTVTIPGMDGAIGISSCPGLREELTFPNIYEDCLLNDLMTIRKWGAVGVVTILDSQEIKALGIKDLPHCAEWLDLRWFHLPFDINGVPDETFETLWSKAGPQLCRLLRNGKRIVVHCKDGTSRSGVIASRLLIELGIPPEQAITSVQKASPGSLQLHSQKKYCCSLPLNG